MSSLASVSTASPGHSSRNSNSRHSGLSEGGNQTPSGANSSQSLRCSVCQVFFAPSNNNSPPSIGSQSEFLKKLQVRGWLRYNDALHCFDCVKKLMVDVLAPHFIAQQREVSQQIVNKMANVDLASTEPPVLEQLGLVIAKSTTIGHVIRSSERNSSLNPLVVEFYHEHEGDDDNEGDDENTRDETDSFFESLAFQLFRNRLLGYPLRLLVVEQLSQHPDAMNQIVVENAAAQQQQLIQFLDNASEPSSSRGLSSEAHLARFVNVSCNLVAEIFGVDVHMIDPTLVSDPSRPAGTWRLISRPTRRFEPSNGSIFILQASQLLYLLSHGRIYHSLVDSSWNVEDVEIPITLLVNQHALAIGDNSSNNGGGGVENLIKSIEQYCADILEDNKKFRNYVFDVNEKTGSKNDALLAENGEMKQLLAELCKKKDEELELRRAEEETKRIADLKEKEVMNDEDFQKALDDQPWLISRPVSFNLVEDEKGENQSFHTIILKYCKDGLWKCFTSKRGFKFDGIKFKNIKSAVQLKTNTGLEIQTALRDAISHPRYFKSVTGWWILEMFFNFLCLILITFISIDLITQDFYNKAFIDSHAGCYYESLTAAVAQNRPAPYNAEKVGTTCMRNDEEFDVYSKRFIEYLILRQNASCNEIVSFVGSRIDVPPEYDSGIFFNVPNGTIGNDETASLLSPPSTSILPLFNATRIYYDQLQGICPDADICQRFLLLTKKSFTKNWGRRGLWFDILVQYDLYIETEWQFLDENCRRNLRIVTIPRDENSSGGWADWGGCLVLSIFLVGSSISTFYLLIIKNGHQEETYASTRDPTEHAKTRSAYFKHWLLVAVSLLLTLVSFCLLTALLSFQIAGLWFLFWVTTIRFLFSVVFPQIARMLSLLYQTFITDPPKESDPKTNYDLAREGKGSWHSIIFTPDPFIVNHWTTARTILVGLCLGFFAVSSAWLASYANRDITSSNGDINAFEQWAMLRPLFIIFQILYVPIGLEFLIYLPQLFGSTKEFPSTYYGTVFYVIVFMIFPSGIEQLPQSVADVSRFVVGIVDGVTTFFGAFDTSQIRLGVLTAILILILLFLKVVDELEDERKKKPWKIIICYSMTNEADENEKKWLEDHERMKYFHRPEDRTDVSTNQKSPCYRLTPKIKEAPPKSRNLKFLKTSSISAYNCNSFHSIRSCWYFKAPKSFEPEKYFLEACCIAELLLPNNGELSPSLKQLCDLVAALYNSSYFKTFVQAVMNCRPKLLHSGLGDPTTLNSDKFISCLEFLSIVFSEMDRSKIRFLPIQLYSINKQLLGGKNFQIPTFDFFFEFVFPSINSFGVTSSSLSVMFCLVFIDPATTADASLSLNSNEFFLDQVTLNSPELILIKLDLESTHTFEQSFDVNGERYVRCSHRNKSSSPQLSRTLQSGPLQSATTAFTSTMLPISSSSKSISSSSKSSTELNDEECSESNSASAVVLYCRATSRSSSTASSPTSLGPRIHSFYFGTCGQGPSNNIVRGFNCSSDTSSLRQTTSQLHFLLCLQEIRQNFWSRPIVNNIELNNLLRSLCWMLVEKGSEYGVPCLNVKMLLGKLSSSWFSDVINHLATDFDQDDQEGQPLALGKGMEDTVFANSILTLDGSLDNLRRLSIKQGRFLVAEGETNVPTTLQQHGARFELAGVSMAEGDYFRIGGSWHFIGLDGQVHLPNQQLIDMSFGKGTKVSGFRFLFMIL